MLRYNRASFFALGVLPALNAIGLFLYGLGISTHGRGGTEAILPVLIVLAVLSLILSTYAAIKRGRDLGWSGWLTAVVYQLSIGMGPVALLLICYFGCAKGSPTVNEYGPPATASVSLWFWVLFMIICTWFALAIAARIS